MILPGYILALYATAFALALGVMGWLAYQFPLGAEARRLSDAAERVGLEQSVPPLQGAALFGLVVALGSGAFALRAGAPLGWFLGAPVVGTLGGALLGQLAARATLRAACRLPLVSNFAEAERLSARVALWQALLLTATSGLVAFGTFVVAERSLGPLLATSLVGFVSAAAAAPAVLFARSGAALLATSVVTRSRSRRRTDVAHAATLAELVAHCFGRAAMTASSFFLVSLLGHFLALKKAFELESETNAAVWLFPLGFPALTGIALLVAGLVVRTNEQEPRGVAFRRSLGVAFTLTLGAVWSLAQSVEALPERRAIAVGASLLVVTLASLVVFVSTTDEDDARLPKARLLKWAGAAVLGLLFFEVERPLLEEAKIPDAFAESLFLSGLLSVLSLLHFVTLARGIQLSARVGAPLLADVRHRPTAPSVSASLSPLYWMVAALVGLLASGLRIPKDLTLWSLSGWAILGASLPLFVTLHSGERVRAYRERVLSLVPREGDGDEPRLLDALEIAKTSILAGILLAPALALGLPLFLFGAHALWPGFALESAGYGMSLGALVTSGTLVSLFDEREPEPFYGHATLLFVLSLAIVILVTLGRLLLSS